jgi:excisionase family DNA binding protein
VDFAARGALSLEEAASYLGLDRRTVLSQLVRKGRIPCRRAGSRYLISRAALDRWLAGGGKP